MPRRLLCAFLAVVMVALLIPTSVIHAHAASDMKASDDVVLYLKTMEGFTAVPRWDYVQWTVGYGNRCPDEHLDRYLEEGIPIEEADALFLEQLAYFEDQVNSFMDRNGIQLEQHQFDAVLSLTYNCGAAWLYGSSSLLSGILNGATGNTLIGLMSQWCTAGGSYLPGLMRRRITEADMFLNGRYNTQMLDNYCYVFFDAGAGTASAPAQGYDCNLYAVPMVTASREGYTFLGWYTAETGGVKVTYLDENMHLMTLYAHWTEGDGEYSGDTDYVEDAVLVTVTGDIVNVRKGPGTGYPVVGSVVEGEKIAITEVTMAGGRLWGKFEKGWLCLEYTDYDKFVSDSGGSGGSSTTTPENPYEVPIYATVIGTSSLTVYNGPDTGYPKVGSLREGQEVLIAEVYKLFTTWWGRLEGGGWVCLNRYLLLHDDKMLAHSFVATITNSYLNVRNGPGTNYSWLSSLQRGDRVEILAVELVDSTVWGQFSGGWISLEYTDFDPTKLEQYWNHSYTEWYDVTDATCLTPGVQHRDCIYCDDVQTRETELADHNYGQWYTIENATCVENGQERRDCQLCDHYEVRDTALTGHSFGQWYLAKEGTCVTLGCERRDCQYCDAFEIRETTYGDHQMGDWYETVAPTLSDDGEERRDCQLCEHYETRVVKPYEHVYGEWYTTTEATCVTDGQERRDCQYCPEHETRVVEALGHAHSEWEETVPATCTTAGQQMRRCQTCGEVEIAVIDPLGHSYGQWEVIVDASCTTGGQEQHTCPVCGETETRDTAPLGHSYGQWEVIQDATCTTGGQEQHTCPVCGEAETREIAALGHSFGDWHVVEAGDCTTDRVVSRSCANCGAEETETTEAPGHSLGDWYTFRAATCETAGEERRECANCKHYETRELEKLEHSFGQWYTYREATIQKKGEERRDCQNCSYYESRETECKVETVTKTYGTLTGYHYLRIRAGLGVNYAVVGQLSYGDRVEILEFGYIGTQQWGRIEAGWICITGYMTLETVEEVVEHTHSFGDWYTITEPTCTTEGQQRRDCACGHYETKAIATTAHNYGSWYTVTAPTCTAAGQERRDCGCGKYETRAVAATGHTMGQWYTLKEATSSEKGLEQRDCQNCDHFEQRETEVKVETVKKIYGTLTGYSYLRIRAGLGVNYAVVGQLNYGDRVEILEFGYIGTQQWGRIEAGWICITGYITLEEVEEVVGHTHSFGAWYTVAAPTCTAAGQERRDCACGEHETRTVAATGHTYGAWYTATAPTCTAEGQQRRDCACGHYETKSLAATGHTMGQWYTVREATASQKGLEQRDCQNCDHFEQRETDVKVETVKRIYGTLTGYSHLWIRAGAGTNYDLVGRLNYGDRVEIFEIVRVGDVQWGRIETGWVCITGYLTLEIVEEVVEHTHSFGDWYIAAAPTCTTEGQERRDCGCGEYETRTVAATGHTMGQWYTVKEATVTEKGLERRDCQHCDYCEEQETTYQGATITRVYATITTALLNVRSGPGTGYGWVATVAQGSVHEVFEQVTVDGKQWGRIEAGWICLTGYTTLEEVVEAEEPANATRVMTVAASALNVRAGAGTGYNVVTSLVYGTKVTVYEQITVGNVTWARIDQGWVSMEYLA